MPNDILKGCAGCVHLSYPLTAEDQPCRVQGRGSLVNKFTFRCDLYSTVKLEKKRKGFKMRENEQRILSDIVDIFNEQTVMDVIQDSYGEEVTSNYIEGLTLQDKAQFMSDLLDRNDGLVEAFTEGLPREQASKIADSLGISAVDILTDTDGWVDSLVDQLAVYRDYEGGVEHKKLLTKTIWSILGGENGL